MHELEISMLPENPREAVNILKAIIQSIETQRFKGFYEDEDGKIVGAWRFQEIYS